MHQLRRSGASMRVGPSRPGTHFTCFTGTKVQTLTLVPERGRLLGALLSARCLYWYKSTSTDAFLVQKYKY
jgi:hypothetical protein